MRKLFLFIIIQNILFALPNLPSAKFRSQMLYYSQEMQEGQILENLKKQGFGILMERMGKIRVGRNGDVRLLTRTTGKSEESWKKRYEFQNYMVFELDSSAVLLLEQGSLPARRKLVNLFVEELQFYSRKYDGIVLSAPFERITEDFHVKDIREALKEEGYSLGVEIDHKHLNQGLIESAADFLIARIPVPFLKSHYFEQSFLEWTRAAQPFFVSLSLEPILISEGPNGEDLFEPAPSIKELRREGYFPLGEKEGELAMIRSFQNGKGEVLQLVEPTLKAFRTLEGKGIHMPYYHFMGSALDLASLHPRVLVSPEGNRPPRLEYSLKREGDDVVLDLSLENPNPVASRQGRAGLGLKLKGYRVVELQMGSFEALSSRKIGQDSYLMMEKPQLGAFSMSSKASVRLKLDGPADKASIESLGWMQPRNEIGYAFSNGKKGELDPLFALKREARTIFRLVESP